MIKKTLQEIQQKLKAPKNQKNKFGGYKYRSCEDILEAVKPILAEYDMAITLSDEVVAVGDRVYIKAIATIYEWDEKLSTTAYAREAKNRKWMDASQITGSTSSYARKYALNGLFAIDDTKDSDDLNTHWQKKTFKQKNFDKLKSKKDKLWDAKTALAVAKKSYKVSKKWEERIKDLYN